MANMKVKLIIDDEIKGVFNNTITSTIPKRKETIQQPYLKTSISRKVDNADSFPITEMNRDCAVVRSRIIIPSNDAPQSLTNISIPEDETPSCTPDWGCNDNTERATTEEEADVFDSIEAIAESDRTENEKAFMLLYAGGFCPPLDELEKALIPIREERSAILQDEAAAIIDNDYLNSKYAAHQADKEDDVETFKKIRTTNKKSVLNEY